MVTAPGPSCGPSAQGVNPPVCCVLAVTYVRVVSVDYWHRACSSSLGGGGGGGDGADILAPGLHLL